MNQSEKIILGIDPGTNIMGYGIISVIGKKVKLLSLGVIHLEKMDGHALKLKNIFEKTLRLLLFCLRPSSLRLSSLRLSSCHPS